MPKVYIPNKSAHDHSDALRFGSLVYMTEGQLDRFNTNQMYRIAAEILDDSEPTDFILPTSLNILCMIICAVFARKHGTLNVLMYKNGKYIARTHVIDSCLTDIAGKIT